MILLSLLPLVFAMALVLGLSWFYWEAAVAGVRGALEQWSLVVSFLQWIDSVGAGGFHVVLAPLIVVALAVPVIVVLSLMLVAWLMTPALVGLVAARRFDSLERKRGAGWLTAASWSIGCMLLALVLLLLSLPLWFAHFALAALQRLRMQQAAEPVPMPAPITPPPHPAIETRAPAALPPP